MLPLLLIFKNMLFCLTDVHLFWERATYEEKNNSLTFSFSIVSNWAGLSSQFMMDMSEMSSGLDFINFLIVYIVEH